MSAPLVLASYVLAAAALYSLLARAMPRAEAADRRVLAMACLLCGPALLAYLLSLVMHVAPGATPRGAVVWTLVLLLAPLAGFARSLRGLPSALCGRRDTILNRQDVFWLALCAVTAALFTGLALLIPLAQNDPLEYASAARVLCAEGRLDAYPMLDGSAGRGFYAPWTHPPGYPLLLKWSMLFAGCGTGGVHLKLPALYSMLAICLALLVALPRRANIYALVLFIGTPAVVAAAVHAAVDPVRLAPAVAALLLLALAIKNDDPAAWMAGGFALGLALFIHSLGAVSAFLLLGGALVAFGTRGAAKRLAWASAAGLVALLIVAPYLWRNVGLFGIPLGDTTAVWELPVVDHAAHLKEVRGLASATDRLLFGVLKGWTTVFFGASWWLLALALPLVSRATAASEKRSLSPVLARLTLAQVVLFLFLAAASFAIGSIALLKNERYFLTVQPAVAILFGLVFAGASRAGENGVGAALWRWSVRVLALASIALTVGYLAWWTGARLGWDALGLEGAEARLAQSRLSEFGHVAELDERLRAGECVLLFNQAEYAFYGSGCFVSYLDSRMVEVYRAQDAATVLERLARLGVRFVYLPRHAMAEVQNTKVGDVLGDPGLARLVWQRSGYRVFELAKPQTRFSHALTSIAAPAEPRNAVSSVSWRMNPTQPFSRSRRVCVDADLAAAPQAGRTDALVVTAQLTGDAFLTVAMSAVDRAAGEGDDAVTLWQGIVRGAREIKAQAALSGNAETVKICVAGEHDSRFTFARYAISRVSYGEPH